MELGRRIRRVSGEVNPTAFLLQRLSIAVQRGNAASVLGTIGSTEVSRVYNYVMCPLLTLARACAPKGYCSRLVSRSVGRLVCGFVYPHVFSRTVAAVDTKRGYVGMCNGRSAQQDYGVALSKNSMFTAGA